MASDPVPVAPGHSLGPFVLGSALQYNLSIAKADKLRYPKIELYVDQSSPLSTPVVVGLPLNGVRLRFDAPDQRLRLIEVLDFKKSHCEYKGNELVKRQDGATFKRIYQLFGAAYPGEYFPPKTGPNGTYVLSWPGISFNFPLKKAAWSPKKDHVSLLGSHASLPATEMALFEGNSWAEARKDLYIRIPSGPRAPAIESAPKDMLPVEIEAAVIKDRGRIILLRRDPAQPLEIVLGQTTPQDLLTELGPPDTTHKRDAQLVLNQPSRARHSSVTSPPLNGRTHATPPSSHSSTGTETFDTDFDSGDADDDPAARIERETFWCYFGHGMDILVGPPSEHTTTGGHPGSTAPMHVSPHLVVLKLVMHGNVPGSYAFNRHRRLRWTLELVGASEAYDSEHGFDAMKPALLRAFANTWPEADLGRGKVVNRTWGAGPSDSTFFLPDADRDLVEGGSNEQWISNTKLYTYPGLTFEVATSGAICALTVS